MSSKQAILSRFEALITLMPAEPRLEAYKGLLDYFTAISRRKSKRHDNTLDDFRLYFEELNLKKKTRHASRSFLFNP